MTTYQLFSAGSNARGQLATGFQDDAHTFTPCIFDLTGTHTPGKVVQIACGSNHTLVLLESPNANRSLELWGCGDGSKGQLGPNFPPEGLTRFVRLDDDVRAELERKGLGAYAIRMLAAGWETSYIVLGSPGQDDVLISMGANDMGSLGVGKGKTIAGSLHVVPLRSLDSVAADSGGSVLKIESLTAGLHHVVVRMKETMTDGSSKTVLAGWGASRHGQLGALFPAPGPVRHAAFCPTPHIVKSDARDIAACALGNQHTILLHSSGGVTALGSNRKSQLSGVEAWENVSAVGCTWNGTYAVVQSQGNVQILATGSNDKGQLAVPQDPHGSTSTADAVAVAFPFDPTVRRLVRMACGSEHVLCLFSVRDPEGSWERRSPSGAEKDTTEVWAWGWNEHGNLGTGDTEDMRSPRRIWPSAADGTESGPGRAIDIWAGCGTSWILVERRHGDTTPHT